MNYAKGERGNSEPQASSGIMEVLISVPWYDGYNLSIVKYNKGKIEGDINYQASVE